MKMFECENQSIYISTVEYRWYILITEWTVKAKKKKKKTAHIPYAS